MPRFFSQTYRFSHPVQSVANDVPALPGRTPFIIGRPGRELISLAKKISVIHRGSHKVSFTIPQNEKFKAAFVYTLPPSSTGSVVQVLSMPPRDSTGGQILEIEYFIPPGGTIRIAVKAYSKDAPSTASEPKHEVLFAENQQSVERFSSLMKAREPILLCIEGETAMQLISTGLFNKGNWKVGKNLFGLPQVTINPITELVVLVAIISVALVAAWVISLIVAMVMFAIEKNYSIEMHELSLGTVDIGGTKVEFSLPTLVIELKPN